jgi:H+-transporting ATPase
VYGAGILMHLSLPARQSLDFLGLVFSGLANVFLVRERGHLWASLPGRFLLWASLADVLVVSLLASQGWLMAALPLPIILVLLAATVLFTLLLDQIKVPLLRRLNRA